MARVCVVVLDPQLAPGDQTTWAFTEESDAVAMAGFLNSRVGQGTKIAWVENVPVARTLNRRVLEYIDSWAELADEVLIDDE